MEPVSNRPKSPALFDFSFFEKGFKVGSVEVSPIDAMVGGLYLLYVGYYIKKFIDSFSDDQSIVTTTVRKIQNFRERVIQKIIYTAQAVSSTMLFFDWAVGRGWIVLKSIARTTLKGVAHSMSILFWGYKCMEAIQNLIELPKLIEKCEKSHVYEKKELEPEIYRQWINLFSNFAFVLASGLQVLALITKSVIVVANIEFLVTASMVLMIAGIAIDLFFDSEQKVVAARLLFSEKEKGYTQIK